MPVALASASLWESAKSDLRGLFPEDVFKLWFDPVVCLEQGADQLVLGVPNDFAAIWINDNYMDLILQRLRLSAGREIKVSLRKASAASASESGATGEGGTEVARPRPAPRRVARPAEERAPTASSLSLRNTFETFVVGDNNQMAAAAARAVADAPGQSYNPLFVYGETGLGKTHLMHAIGHAIVRRRPEARIAYLSAEKFTNDFIQAIQENALTKFRQRYRHVDVLLIDDIQFLAGKERSQEEFFHTFNDLHGAGKQIVLSSDRRASEIEKLEARLVSRFEWGLPVDIQPPDFETRLAILRTKAAAMKCELPAPVAAFIAQHISRNIRRLEGALIKVVSYGQLSGRPIDLTAVEMLLKDVLMEQAQNQLTIEGVQKRVADHFQIRHSDMTSKRRPNNIAIPRQIAMYLVRNLIPKHSLQEIGDAFGGRDHGTVIHACKAVDNMLAHDAHMKGQIEFLRTALSR
jgi:chromosomal replication initiator protein